MTEITILSEHFCLFYLQNFQCETIDYKVALQYTMQAIGCAPLANKKSASFLSKEATSMAKEIIDLRTALAALEETPRSIG